MFHIFEGILVPTRSFLSACLAATRHRRPARHHRGIKRSALSGLLSLAVAVGVVAPVALTVLPAEPAHAATTPGNWYYNSSLTTLIERTPSGAETTIPLTGQVFSIALDPTQKQLYGVGAATTADYRVLKKIDLNGTVTSLGVISGLPAKQSIGYANAAFDNNGVFYISGQKVLGGPTFLWSVNVQTVSLIKETQLTGAVGGDLAFLDGALYTLDGGISRIDIATGTVTKNPLTGLTGSTAAMFSSRGHLYMNSGSNLMEILGYNTTTPRAVIVGTLTTPSDGASDPNDPNPFLSATADTVGSIPRGGSAGNVFANDLLRGVAITDTTAVAGTVTVDGGATGVTIGSDGSINVPGTVANGTYTITYRVCETANTNICDTATATFTVIDNITAVADAISSTTAGGTSGNVLGNDTINGTVLNPADVTLTFGGDGGLTGATINASGEVSVPAGAAPGEYTLSYTICQNSDLTNCSTADVVVTVAHDAITLVDDDFTATPVSPGGSSGSVLGNDSINDQPITPSSVSVSLTDDGGLTGATITADGSITVPVGTRAGEYTLTYQVCQNSDVTNCATAAVTIAVSPAALDIRDDDFTATPVAGTGGTAGNVLANDTSDGDAIDPTAVTVSVVTDGGLTGVTIAPDGTVTVPAGLRADTYSVDYRVCENLNPTNCSTATATITVLPAELVANPTDLSATPVPNTGGPAGNVLTDDTINGGAIDPTTVSVTVATDGGLTGVTIGSDGTLTVPANAKPGTYTVGYRLCEILNPTNCVGSTVTVVVEAAIVTTAHDDFSATASTTGGVVGNLLENDTVNGSAIDPSLVTLTLTSNGGLTGATVAPDGTLSIPANAPAGVYTLSYTVCLINDPTNCSTNTVTVEIVAAAVAGPVTGPAAGTAGTGSTGVLATTGSSIVGPVMGVGALLVALGGVFLALRRRKVHTES